MSALVICTGGGIGDVLLATPVIRALGQRFGDVVALTTPQHRSVLEHDPELAEVWTTGRSLRADVAKARARRFSAAVVTWASPRAAALPFLAGVPLRAGQARRLYSPLFTHRVVVRSERGDRTSHWTQILLDFARALGCDTADASPRFAVTPEDRASAAGLLARAGVATGEPYVVLHPTRGISAARERWPIARLGELARALGEQQRARVVVTGGPQDRAVADAIAIAGGAIALGGRSTLGELGALAQGSRAVVAMDSGPMHISAAVGAPTVGIFALQSDEPRRWAPLGACTAVVTATYPCPPSHRKETCPNFACVAELDIAGVLATLDALLNEGARR